MMPEESRMAMSRKDALKKLDSRARQAEWHLAKIAENRGHSSIRKWKHEVGNWLREMQEVLPHVGKKTAEEWQARIDIYRTALEG
jgi:hypothetical protein